MYSFKGLPVYVGNEHIYTYTYIHPYIYIHTYAHTYKHIYLHNNIFYMFYIFSLYMYKMEP